nr:serine hydrolase [Qipengyuania sphaerica]
MPDPVDSPAPARGLARVAQVLDLADFHGEALVSPAPGTIHRVAHDDFPQGTAWPWGSVTKQVMAVVTLQQVAEGKTALDTKIATLLPPFAQSEATVLDLLTHRSGFANPDDRPATPSGFPAFYGPEGQLDDGTCQLNYGPVVTEGYVYNNCDYIVLGAFLQRAAGESLDALISERIGKPSGWENTSLLGAEDTRPFAAAEPLYDRVLPRYRGAGALVGPLEDMVRFDRALLSGLLLDAQSRERLWRGDPALGYMALGQWSFEAPIRGCERPVRIIERRGAIGKYQVRNIILPQKDIVIAMATDRGEKDYSFGEIWTGSGVTHDVLSAVACT